MRPPFPQSRRVQGGGASLPGVQGGVRLENESYRGWAGGTSTPRYPQPRPSAEGRSTPDPLCGTGASPVPLRIHTRTAAPLPARVLNATRDAHPPSATLPLGIPRKAPQEQAPSETGGRTTCTAVAEPQAIVLRLATEVCREAKPPAHSTSSARRRSPFPIHARNHRPARKQPPNPP